MYQGEDLSSPHVRSIQTITHSRGALQCDKPSAVTCYFNQSYTYGVYTISIVNNAVHLTATYTKTRVVVGGWESHVFAIQVR